MGGVINNGEGGAYPRIRRRECLDVEGSEAAERNWDAMNKVVVAKI